MENWEKAFEKIYMTMSGNIQMSDGVPWVNNAFAEGTAYSQAYEDFWTAREHICTRFGLDWEDEDLERFMNAILNLERDVSIHMFRYGIEYAQRGFQL